MRKLTKKALSLILCLILAVSVFSGTINVSAAEVQVNNGPLNLDFSDGLNHWVNIGTEQNPVAILTADKGLKAGSAYTNWAKIQTENFRLPNLKVGDIIRIKFEIDVDLSVIQTSNPDKYTSISGDKERMFEFNFNQYDKNGTSVKNIKKDYYYSNLDGGVVLSSAQTVTDPDNYFWFSFGSGLSVKDTWTIRNIRVLVQNEATEAAYKNDNFYNTTLSTYAYTYTAYRNGATPVQEYFDGTIEGGTAENGYTYLTLLKSSSSLPVDFYGVLDAPKNLDFADGLKYWAAYYTSKNGATVGTSAGDEVQAVSNGLVTLNKKTRNKQGIVTQKFKVANLKATDKVRVILKFKPVEGDENKVIDGFVKIRTFITDAARKQGVPFSNFLAPDRYEKDGTYKDFKDTAVKAVIGDDGWYYINRSITVGGSEADEDTYFQIMVGYGDEAGTAGDFSDIAQLQIKNVYVFKETTEDSKHYTYAETGESWTRSPLLPVGGTEEYGIPAFDLGNMSPTYYSFNHTFDFFSNVSNYGVNEGLLNGDFSKGFKHWSVFRFYRDKRTSWSDSSKTVLESAYLSGIANVDKTSGIVTINSREFYDDGVTPFNDNGLGLMSQPFTLSGLTAGDKLLVAMDATDGSDIIAGIVEVNSTKGSYGWNVVGRAAAEAEVKSMPSELWISNELTITDPNNYFMVYIRNKNPQKIATFGNIRIFKVTNDKNLIDITDGYNAKTDAVVNANGGTAEDGILIARPMSGGDYYNTNLTTTDILNGDFTDGLKYWRIGLAGGGRRGVPSYFTRVVDGAAVVTGYFDNKQGTYTSIRTPLLNLDAVQGQKVIFSFDVLKIGANNGFRVRVFENGTAIFDPAKSFYSTSVYKTDEIEVKAGATYELEIASYNAIDSNGKTAITIDNVAILIEDAGGLENAPMVKLDGSLIEDQLSGDANYDGKVDLLDLVRTKKYAAGKTDGGIFLAAVDTKGNEGIDADDLTELIAIILKKK